MYVDEDEVRDGGKRNDHSNGSRKKDQASTPSVHEVPWRNSREEVGNAVDSSHEDSITTDPSG